MVLGQCKLIIISSVLNQCFKTTFTQIGTDVHNNGSNPKEADY